jgi:hypothetical protein
MLFIDMPIAVAREPRAVTLIDRLASQSSREWMSARQCSASAAVSIRKYSSSTASPRAGAVAGLGDSLSAAGNRAAESNAAIKRSVCFMIKA